MKNPVFLLSALLIVTAPLASAQFSTNPAANLAIADLGAEQAQPKIVATPDGGALISWFDSDPSGTPAFGYDVRLQRIDAGGRELWPHGGVLIADRGFSSTQDYDLDVDGDGNALLAFRDDRFGGTQITATKVDASGVQVWGAGGVQLTNTGAFLAAPVIAASGTGVIVGWSQDSSTRLQRLDANGVNTWGADVIMTPGSGSYSVADMHASNKGSVVLSIVHGTGGFGSPRHLFAQKVSMLGVQRWGATPLAIFNGGSLQFGNFPNFITNQAGGAIFAWYSSSPALEVFAQHVLSNGTEVFPHNGVKASTNGAQLRVAPAVAFDPDEQEIFLLYQELNNTQSMRGLSAQKLDALGNRQWGATGKSLIALGNDEIGDTAVVALGDGAQLFWSESAGFGQDVLMAQTLDDAGTVINAPTGLSTNQATKYRVSAAKSSFGFAQVVWQDDAAGSPDIMAQNYLPNGTLGGLATSVSRNGSGANPLALTSPGVPSLGTVWQASVDTSSLAGSFGSALLIYAGPNVGSPLPEGELLVDLGSPQLVLDFQVTPGPTATHSFPLPALVDFIGVQVSAQALILDLAGSQLTNALDLTLGL